MDDPRTFLPLSAQQFQILLALTDADRHGYGIILDIEQRTRGDRPNRHGHALHRHRRAARR